MSRRYRRTRKGGWGLPQWMTGSTQTQPNQPYNGATNGTSGTNDPRNRNTQGKSMFGNLLNTFTQTNDNQYGQYNGAENSYDTSGTNQFGYNPLRVSQGNSSMVGNWLGTLTGNTNGGGKRRRRTRRSRR